MEQGTVINDRYEIIDLLGEGGMGTVYKVKDYVENRIVALKLIKEKIYSEVAANRFKNEFKLTIELDHPNVIKVYDLGTYKKTDTYFFTMELMKGKSLTEIYRKLTDLEKYELLIQIAKGLDYIHQKHIIHFDIKPDNVFLTERKGGGYNVKIMDFGLASIIEEFGGKVRGTMSYIAPEVLLKKDVDYRCDLYSLGMVIYHIFAKKIPFGAYSSIKTVAQAKMDEIFMNEKEFVDLEDNFLKNLITDLCRAKREERIQSARQLINHLETALEFNIRDTEVREQDIFANKFYDNTKIIDQLKSGYLNFCLRGDKKSGKLTSIVSDAGNGKSMLLERFNVTAQLQRIQSLFIRVEREDAVLNSLFRKLAFGLYSYSEKNDITVGIFEEMTAMLDKNGNFIFDNELIPNYKKVLKRIINNLSTDFSPILIIDDFSNLNESEKPILDYFLHLVVKSPIFMILSVTQTEKEMSALEDYERLFYLYPPQRIHIENMTESETLEFISILLETEIDKIDKDVLAPVMRESSGNKAIIRDYLKFLLDNSVLIFKEGKYEHNTFSNKIYLSRIDDIYLRKLAELNTEEKYLLLFISEKFDVQEDYITIKEILDLKNFEATANKLVKENLLDIRYDRGRKVYFIKNESLENLIRITFMDMDLKGFYGKLAQYYLNSTKSPLKYTYFYLRSTAETSSKAELLENTLAYLKENDNPIEERKFLIFYYNNFDLDEDKKKDILKRLIRVLVSLREFEDAYLYYEDLEELLSYGGDDTEYAKTLVYGTNFSDKKIELEEKKYKLEKASKIYINHGMEKEYFDTFMRYLLLLFRKGLAGECKVFVEKELEENKTHLSKDIVDKLTALFWYFKPEIEYENLDIYNNIVKIYSNLESDFQFFEENLDLVQIILISQIFDKQTKSAENVVKIYLEKLQAHSETIEKIVLLYIYAYLLESKGNLYEAFDIYLEIEEAVEKKRGMSGLLFILSDKLDLMTRMKIKPERIESEFFKLEKICRKQKDNYYLFCIYTSWIDYLISKAEWRDVDIYIRFALTILEDIKEKPDVAKFIGSASFYYYIIKDKDSFLSFIRKVNTLSYVDVTSEIEDVKLLFIKFTEDNTFRNFYRIKEMNKGRIKFLNIIKYFNDICINYIAFEDEFTDFIIQMKESFLYNPYYADYLEMISLLVKEEYKKSVDITTKYGTENFIKGYIFDCYYFILTSLYYFRSMDMIKNAHYFEDKFEKLSEKISSKLPYENRDNFLYNYYKF